jgi:hypothetical protein
MFISQNHRTGVYYKYLKLCLILHHFDWSGACIKKMKNSLHKCPVNLSEVKRTINLIMGGFLKTNKN